MLISRMEISSIIFQVIIALLGGLWLHGLLISTVYFKTAVCGGEISLTSGLQQVIKSPGYDDPNSYTSHQECNWWIKVNYILKYK